MRHLPAVLAVLILTAPVFAQSKPADGDKAGSRTQQLNEERDELKAEYELLLQKQKNKIAEMEAEINRLSTESRLASEKQGLELRKIKEELERLSSGNRLADEKIKAETALKNSEFQRLTLENKLAAEAAKKEIESMTASILKLKAENELLSEQEKKAMITDSAEKMSIELEMKRMDLKERKLKFEKLLLESRMDKLNSDISLRAKKEEWKKESNTEPVYDPQPFSKGVLTISDRRIPLNGPVYSVSADYITDRIHYFNNISTAPIFLVIDNSPGGSVMSGYRILKAMESSKAPVYVVVKSYAASMAAGITTLAKKSFAYPNAIILHHQMSTVNWGNMTQLKEQLEKAKDWERRILDPVAKKMGISTDAFRKRMYENSSDGNWEEFADKAVALKWVDHLVDRIEETGFVKNPDFGPAASGHKMSFPRLEERTDESGRRYVNLPRLEPFDFYFIHNPDKYYR